MWKQAILQSYPGAQFADPATAAELDAAEARLGYSLPSPLRELLLETNGVQGRWDVDTVWTLDRIVEQNQFFRTDPTFATLYMPFDPLLFFGDNGGGDQFAFVQTPPRPDIFAWDHESDSRRWVANNFLDYLGRSLATSSDEWYR
jgi:hypothetical protein